MAIKVKINIDMNNSKIAAIKAWRGIVGVEAAVAYGLTEAKNFIESKTGTGYFEVVFSDAQFGRFVLASSTECNGGVTPAGSYGGYYKPVFGYSKPEAYTPPPKILDFTA